TFTACDGEFVLAVGNDGQFRQLCDLLKRPDLATDDRFATNPARVEHRDILVPILSDLFHQQTVNYWVDHLLQMGIPAGPINTVAQALTDPHVIERGLIQKTQLDNGEILQFVGSPLNLSATPPHVRYPPPALGQHTDEVLHELLNLDEDALTAYRENGVI
ncbi:MAG: CoA transferase, partial [Phototrophicales bacterium]